MGAEKNVGRIVRQDEWYRDLPCLDQVAVHPPDCQADARAGAVGADQHLRLYPRAGRGSDRPVEADGQYGLIVSALGSVPGCFLRQHPVEGAAVDHKAVKMVRDVWRPLADESQHARDLLRGHGANAGDVLLDRSRNEFGALHRCAGSSPPLQSDDAEARGCCYRGSPAPSRPEPDDEDVRCFDMHEVSHAAQAGRPANPSSAMEQQA